MLSLVQKMSAMERNYNKQHSEEAANVIAQNHYVSRSKRGSILGNHGGFRGCTIWFTGFSGAGKTSVSFKLEEYLISRGIPAYSLDGDNMRTGLNKNLGFSKEDREENIRRVGEVSKLFADAGHIALCSFVSPFAKDRLIVRKIHENNNLPFFEVFVDTPLAVCEKRDNKGLYEKARRGIIKGFTGIDQEYEKPDYPELVVKTVALSISQSMMQVVNLLKENGIIPKFNVRDEDSFKMEELFVSENNVQTGINDAVAQKSLVLNNVDLQWIQVLSEGWATPLKGFMRESEFLQTLHFNSLSNLNQSVPIILSITTEQKDDLRDNSAIALCYQGSTTAILRNIEIYSHRKEERCARQCGTTDRSHPYVNFIMESGDWIVGGDLQVLRKVKWDDGLDTYRLTPNELRKKFEVMRSDAVFAFQLRRPMHNGHVLLINEIRRQLLQRGFRRPLLLLHSLGGWTKEDDIPVDVCVQQYRAMLDDGVLDADNTVLAIYPSPTMYVGPTEMQWYARLHMTAGVNFLVVEQDPTNMSNPCGVQANLNGNLYESTYTDCVLKMTPTLSSLEFLPCRLTAYDKKHMRMDFFDPSRALDFDFISGTRMRAMARCGAHPPQGFMSAKAWQVLSVYYQNLKEN